MDQSETKKITTFRLIWLDARMETKENKEYLKDLAAFFAEKIYPKKDITEYDQLIGEITKGKPN
jgi:hypothetical protein